MQSLCNEVSYFRGVKYSMCLLYETNAANIILGVLISWCPHLGTVVCLCPCLQSSVLGVACKCVYDNV